MSHLWNWIFKQMTAPYFEMRDFQVYLERKKFVNLGERYFLNDSTDSSQRYQWWSINQYQAITRFMTQIHLSLLQGYLCPLHLVSVWK